MCHRIKHFLPWSIIPLIGTYLLRPGHSNFDTYVLFEMWRTGEYSNWVPTAPAIIWGVLKTITGDTANTGSHGGLLFAQLTLFAIAFSFLSWQVFRKSLKLNFLFLLLLLANPVFLVYSSTLFKESWGCALFILATAMLIQTQKTLSRSFKALTLLILILAALFRPEYSLIAVFLCPLLYSPQKEKVNFLLSSLAILIIPTLLNVLPVNTKYARPDAQIALMDLTAASKINKTMLLPKSYIEDYNLELKNIEESYFIGDLTSLFFIPNVYQKLTKHVDSWTPPYKAKELWQSWRSYFIKNPIEYLKIRFIVFKRLLFANHNKYFTFNFSMQNYSDWGLNYSFSYQNNRAITFIKNYSLKLIFLFQLAPYLLLLSTLLFYFRRLPFTYESRVLFNLTLSQSLYVALLFFIVTSSSFRFIVPVALVSYTVFLIIFLTRIDSLFRFKKRQANGTHKN